MKISPTNGVAQAYFGYILKLSGDLENGVLYMRKGLRAVREVIADPRYPSSPHLLEFDFIMLTLVLYPPIFCYTMIRSFHTSKIPSSIFLTNLK